MKRVILLFLLLGLSFNSFGQINIRYDLDTINFRPYVKFISFQEVNDTIYIIGQRWVNINNVYRYKSFLVTMTNTGQVLNRQDFDFDFDRGDLIYTNDGSIACVGTQAKDTLTLFQYYPALDTTLITYFSPDSLDLSLVGKNLVQTSDNHYLLMGLKANYNIIFNPIDQLIKTDSLGNEIWRKDYVAPPPKHTVGSFVKEAKDKNYIIGRTIFKGWDINPNHEAQINIEKIDTAGNTVWEYTSPNNRLLSAWDGLPTDDGGVVYCGVEGTKVQNGADYRGYVAKLDSNKQVVWEHTLGHPEFSVFYDIQTLSDGSCLVSGIDAITYPEGSSINNNDSARGPGWLVKFSSDGTKLWERHFMKIYDQRTLHYLQEFRELSNGDLLGIGFHHRSTTPSGDWGWLIRTDSFGCIVPGCQLLDNTEDISVVFDNEVVVFPNPASEVVRFRFEKAIDEDTEIRVYSGLGQLVGQGYALANDTIEINGSDWNSGMYFYGIYVEGRLVKQGQILVQH